MNILFPVSELAKVYHLGGLGDIAYSLPKALKQLCTDIRVALPYHPEIDSSFATHKEEEFTVRFDNDSHQVSVYSTLIPETNVPLYLFANDNYLSKPSGVGDEATTKFAFFSLAICTWLLAKTSPWQPDLIHLNDWHVSLIPSILKHRFQVSRYPTLLTIHNLNFQGTASSDIVEKLHLEPCVCKALNWDKNDGDVNLLMQGIIHSNWVNAVSPTYAKEILTDEYGAFLNPVINSLTGKLSGILNGIDTQEWNSTTDPHIENFNLDNLSQGKLNNKKNLLQRLNIPYSQNNLLVSYVGRVDPNQKGVQLIIDALKENIIGNALYPFIFLGTGDPNLESQIEELAFSSPYIHATCKFDMPLSHQIYASSDLMLIPSKYEPCGLVQMIAMRYGTIPLARNTGGLSDSISEGVTGFLFSHYNRQDFISKLQSVLDQLKNTQLLINLQKNCYQKDFSWAKSAVQYLQLYRQILSKSLNKF